MRYVGMPAGMWLLFAGSFRSHLVSDLNCDAGAAARITSGARRKYKEIIASLPEFEKNDRFLMNIVSYGTGLLIEV